MFDSGKCVLFFPNEISSSVLRPLCMWTESINYPEEGILGTVGVFLLP